MTVKVKMLIVWMILLAGWGEDLSAQNNADAINYINTYKELAISEMQRTGVPATISLAQGIHETEAGTSELVRKSNNHFGIKCKDEWTGEKVYHDDDARGECFRKYASPADSYRDHSNFLRNRPYYTALFDLDPTDYAGWANGLKKAGYATNPRYAQILIKIIEDYHLEQYSLIALGKLKASDEVVLTAPGAGSGNPLRDMGKVDGTPGKAGQGGGSLPAPVIAYPAGEFLINKTRVVFVKAGVSLLSIADQYDIPLGRLLEFNDMKEEDVLDGDQLLFLQRKRKTGSVEFHTVREGETAYAISQAEGVRYQDLLDYNRLRPGVQPAAGEKIYLQGPAPSRPLVNNAN